MTIIILALDDKSDHAIKEYILTQGLQAKREHHSTLLYSEAHPVFERRTLVRSLESMLPITLDPATYRFDIFGKGNLALTYTSSQVSTLQKTLYRAAVRQMIVDWPNARGKELALLRAAPHTPPSPIYPMNLHVTFAKNFSGNVTLPAFAYPLRFVEITWEQNYPPREAPDSPPPVLFK
jgi:hypothetical protein